MGAVTELVARTLGLPFGRPLTRADLETLPDDGHRYELIDGVLLVTPAPSREHQDLVLNLAIALRAACTEELHVMIAPFAVALADDELQPDVLVARRSDLTSRELPAAPVLAVEVLSPSTRRFDLQLKRTRYEEAGTASYWVIDPIALTLTAWDLVEGAYVEVAHVSGNEEYAAARPFPVRVLPAALR